MAPNFVCLSLPINCKYLKLRFSATFGTCYSSQMPSSRLKCGEKLRNMSPCRFVSTPQRILLRFKYSTQFKCREENNGDGLQALHVNSQNVKKTPCLEPIYFLLHVICFHICVKARSMHLLHLNSV